MAQRNKKVSRTTNRFSEIPKANINRSTFNRSHGVKTTFNASKLIPIFCDDVLPGDTFNLSMNGFTRMATPLKPIMDNLYLDTFFFFVPTRLVWGNFKRFMGEQADPGDSTDYLVPRLAGSGGTTVGSNFDYLGIPTGTVFDDVRVSCLPSRCIQKIWNDWFRDENLQDTLWVNTNDGPDGTSAFTAPLPRGKRHDYFTSCLPWPQKGDAVTIPLGTDAPVYGIGPQTDNFVANAVPIHQTGGYESTPANAVNASLDASNIMIGEDPANTGYPNIYADLSQATSATINTLREAFQIQKLLERDARGGTRYTEIVKSHFNVTSPDARQMRPEYLGGGTTPININPVAQTTEVTGSPPGTPQGNLAAVGTGAWSGHGFVKSFTEHGHIIGFACVRADLTYQQGLERSWTRETRYDYFFPALQALGEQAVLQGEIFTHPNGTGNDIVFGYQERYAEYRYKPSIITGAWRSQDQPGTAADLDVWHLAQEFSTAPTLNSVFIEEDVPMARISAVPSEPDFLCDIWFNLKCARPMPVYGVPGLIDHF